METTLTKKAENVLPSTCMFWFSRQFLPTVFTWHYLSNFLTVSLTSILYDHLVMVIINIWERKKALLPVHKTRTEKTRKSVCAAGGWGEEKRTKHISWEFKHYFTCKMPKSARLTKTSRIRPMQKMLVNDWYLKMRKQRDSRVFVNLFHWLSPL